ncbi:MAG: hypothetical protein JO202_09385 [Ktedonobacteraceae bacterium]|nr:hypothetical protein [Ktedonobacteraceae bacterium]
MRGCSPCSGKASGNQPWPTRPGWPASGDGPAAWQEAVRYVQRQRDWMGTYQQWQPDGLGERAVAVGSNLRLQKRGMPWKRATAVVALRVGRIHADRQPAAA